MTVIQVSPTVSEGKSNSLRVLLVEDDEFVRAAVSELMTENGHEVVAVATAEAAREALASAAYDLLFTDLTLPGASGMDLACAALAIYPGLRVVISSGHKNTLIPPAGGIRFLAKPYDLAVLESLLEEIVAERARVK